MNNVFGNLTLLMIFLLYCGRILYKTGINSKKNSRAVVIWYKYPIFIILAITSYTNLFSQTVSNVRAILDQDEDKILITYDLIADYRNESFQVQLFGAFPDSTVELKHVTGDIGKFINPGSGKKIYWNYNNELVYFTGNVGFKVEVQPMFEFESIKNRFRRGVFYEEQCLSKHDLSKIDVTIYSRKSESDFQIEYEIKEDRMNFSFTKDFKTKGIYQFHFLNEDDGIEFYSGKIRVKRRIPLMTYITPVIIFTGYLLFNEYEKIKEPMPEPPGVEILE